MERCAVRSLHEFKAKIVDRSFGQVVRDFDLAETAVREWVKHADRNAGTREDGSLTSDERRSWPTRGGRTAG